MKLAVLYSGGKDSNYALFKASKYHDVRCLITMKSVNQDSYMFQTPGNDWIDLQAECLELPLIRVDTQGEKEKELDDLKVALYKAISNHGIEGVVTGAIKSAYQASRVQKICRELNLKCFNPLWQINEKKFLEELLENNFEIVIIGVAAWPLDEKFLGIKIDKDLKENLLSLSSEFLLSPIGEGGEFETFVLDSPLFRKKIQFLETKVNMDGEHSGVLIIKNARVVEK